MSIIKIPASSKSHIKKHPQPKYMFYKILYYFLNFFPIETNKMALACILIVEYEP